MQAFDSVCARCRRANEKLFLKGDKCLSPKCPMVRRAYAPGVHGVAARPGAAGGKGGSGKGGSRGGSEYGKQLREKQALRATYGIRERQLKKYYALAVGKKGVTGEMLIKYLESRLDNVVFRMGFGTSRAHARQLVGHGMFSVNGRATNIPSFQVSKDDVVKIKETKQSKPVFIGLADRLANKTLPNWAERVDTYTAKVTATPGLEPHEMPVDVQMIVEFYSR